uniref:PIN domain-containing protein n=1 Tax=Candidatus Kentrum sp. LFY TaxID=2126342 RepID=A0A450X1K8_9GAMM|nr:MAG: PIN domain-containing protein [Candidatus Kentron sp. LFY]
MKVFDAPPRIEETGVPVKKTVYVETSVLSYLTARPSNDLRAMANQGATAEWWEIQRPNYHVVVSDLVLSEAGRGHSGAARRRLAAIADLPLLRISEDVRVLAKALIENHALPEKAEADAYHIAMTAVNGVEYLLTWNCTHIANAHARPKIEATCRALGLEPPIICTPLQLMEP